MVRDHRARGDRTTMVSGSLEVSSNSIYHSTLEPSFNFSVSGLVRHHFLARSVQVSAPGSPSGIKIGGKLLTKKIFHREQLYSDFIRESAPALADAIQHTLHDPSKLIPIYALLSRIRLSSSSLDYSLILLAKKGCSKGA
jgi:hypothetical protein